MKESAYTKKLKAERVVCSVCYHQCLIPPDGLGRCQVRQNKSGKLFLLNFQKITREEIEPIESVPLYHFLPGSVTYKIGTWGENFTKEEEKPDTKTATGEQLAKRASKKECKSLTFCYNEPTMAFETMIQAAKAAKSLRLKTAVVTNGYLQERPLKELMKAAHAILFELPSAKKETFLAITGGKLFQVQKSIMQALKGTIWVEVLTTLTPETETLGEMQSLVEFLAPLNVPWHLRKSAEVEEEKLQQLKALAKDAGMTYVYTEDDAFCCQKCGKLLVDEEEVHIKKGACMECKAKIPGIF